MTPLERLSRRVAADPVTGCWLWTGPVNRFGYGRFQVNRRSLYVHRFAWECVHGPIPDGLEIDHLCRVRSCVNVAHLELVTHKENIRRSAGRPRPTRCPHGHAYDEANTLHCGGTIYCRTCHRARDRARYAAKRAAA